MVLLTVTGPPGSGKSTACKLIRERTGLDYIYAGQIFRERAKELGLSPKEVGTNMAILSEICHDLAIIKWSYSNSTTWMVTSRAV